MTYTVAITKQGQISIPAALRDLLGFSQPGTAVMRVEGTKATLEPVRDLLSLEGALKDRVPKHLQGKSLDKLKKIQKETIIQAYVDRYKKSLR